MDDDSRVQSIARWGLGLIGLGAVAAYVGLPKGIGIWVALAILLLAILLFGGFYWWQRRSAKRQSEQFTSGIDAQTAAAPKAVSDPKMRADLDNVRQKFQTGLQEFKSRGKDIYKLPWYVIIGESGSGKTEAIRHSEMDFPKGLQDEFQGGGGTINMDWWFTNRGIILDTAGSMIFNEAPAGKTPEWREFLRLLKKTRSHCPINGLLMVLSVESLIRDSADDIKNKSGVLGEQLDLIQRTLDVRFPVFLLVTKCDLLTGFREFFDNIDDPLLQQQILGWSNPAPLDEPFRPDLVKEHLKSVAECVRRRRLALLREVPSGGRAAGDTEPFFASPNQPGPSPAAAGRLDEVDSMFALPESILRLAPRLQRYLERIFVAGEWSAKPVFLRGIYFTSSMCEGKALDEALTSATGLSFDQLPEDRPWEKNRSFFLRDLFHEKVFRESGLVTRATNTLKLLRQQQLVIFGAAGVALLALLAFAWLGYRSLRTTVVDETKIWQAGANGLKTGTWSPPIVSAGSNDLFHFVYGGANLVEGTEGLNVAQYQRRLMEAAYKPLAVGAVFQPVKLLYAGGVKDRERAQRVLFERAVLSPLVQETRAKMTNTVPADAPAVARHRAALLALMQLEADELTPAQGDGSMAGANATETAAQYLQAFLSYLTDAEAKPDTNLTSVFAWTYSKDASAKNKGLWPPADLPGGNTLSSNLAIQIGLSAFNLASRNAQTNIHQELGRLNTLADRLQDYQRKELDWLTNANDACAALDQALWPVKTNLDAAWSELRGSTNFGPWTNLTSRYAVVENRSSNASVAGLTAPIEQIKIGLPEIRKTTGLFKEIQDLLGKFASQAAGEVQGSYQGRNVADLDSNYLAAERANPVPAYQLRWPLYTGACALASAQVTADDSVIGDGWTNFLVLQTNANKYRDGMRNYHGPYEESVSNACERIAGQAQTRLEEQYVGNYVEYVSNRLARLAATILGFQDVTNAKPWFDRVGFDLSNSNRLGEQSSKIEPVKESLEQSQRQVVQAYATSMTARLKANVKFPAHLESSESLDAGGLANLKDLLGGLEAELANTAVWQTFPDGAGLLARLRPNRYAPILNALLKPDATVTGMEILFNPPAPGGEDSAVFNNQVRYLKLFVGGVEKYNHDLSQLAKPTPLAQATMDAAVTFQFYNDFDRKELIASWSRTNWMLPRAIREGLAERAEDGREWTLQMDLGGTNRPLTAFQVRLLQSPLPKKEDWP